MLEGEMGIETSDGTVRRFGPGDVFPAEDTTGRGLISRVVNKQHRRSIFVTLDLNPRRQLEVWCTNNLQF